MARGLIVKALSGFYYVMPAGTRFSAERAGYSKDAGSRRS